MKDYRGEKLRKNVAVMFIVKFMSMGISFLYMPLLLHSLETEQYAVWLTLTSIVSWITVFDIGLGNGLRNKLAEAIAKNEYDLGRQYVSTAYCTIFLLSIILILVFSLSFSLFSWNHILNATSIPTKALNILVYIVFISFILNFSLSLINSVMYALQMPGLVATLSLIGQFISFILVYIAVRFFNETRLLLLGSIIAIVPVVVLLISTIIIFNHKCSKLAPSVKFFRREKIKDILTIGAKFFFIQIITIVLFQANNLIITHTIDNTAVVEYNIAYKYTYILVTMFTIICMPMWSATTDAYTKGDIEWIARVRKKLYYVLCFFTFAGIAMLVLSKPVYRIWIGADCPDIAFSTTALLLLYSVFMMVYAANGYIINGIGKLKVQILCTSLLAMMYIPLAILFGKTLGLVGILMVLCLNSFANGLWSSIQLNKIIKGTAHGIWNK